MSYDFGWWFGTGIGASDINLLDLAILGYAGDKWSTKWNNVDVNGTDANDMYESMVKYIVDRDEKNELTTTTPPMSDVDKWDILYWRNAEMSYSTEDGDIRVRIYVDERGPKGKGNDGTVYIYEEVYKEDK